MTIGLLSDTHGLLDPALGPLFRGVDLILHAGDVTGPDVVHGLARIAPVHVARGNNDEGAFGASLHEHVWVGLGRVRALVVHRIGTRKRLDPRLSRALERRPAEIVVHGHSHRPWVALLDGRLLVNPGSAGPRRFSLPRVAGILRVHEAELEVRLFDLDRPGTPWGEPFLARL